MGWWKSGASCGGGRWTCSSRRLQSTGGRRPKPRETVELAVFEGCVRRGGLDRVLAIAPRDGKIFYSRGMLKQE